MKDLNKYSKIQPDKQKKNLVKKNVCINSEVVTTPFSHLQNIQRFQCINYTRLFHQFVHPY